MTRFGQTWGWYLIFGIALAPVIIWIQPSPLQYRFDTLTTTLLNLGRLSALVGICLFSTNFLLAARPRWLEGAFGGLNKVFRAHHTFGGLAFILLLVHPILITAQYLPISLEATSQFALSLEDWPRNFGRLGLLTLMGVLIITYYIPLKYHWWKFSHQFMGLALFLSSLHVFFIPSDLSRYPSLRYYILTVVGLGLGSYLYRVVFGKFLVSRFSYSVDAVKKYPGGILEISLKPLKYQLNHRPGQFLFISFRQEGIKPEFHPFSITSPVGSEKLSIGVKVLGDFTKTLPMLEPGAIAKIEGPFGRFYLPNNAYNDQVWIAGGIGITPFLSMARSLTGEGGKIDFYYCVKTMDEAVFLPELITLAKRNPRLSIYLQETKTKGYLTAEFINARSSLENKEIFVCGPNPMMASIREQCLKLGIDNQRIHTEEFDL